MISFFGISIILFLIGKSQAFVHKTLLCQAIYRKQYSTTIFRSVSNNRKILKLLSVDEDNHVDSIVHEDKHSIPDSIQQINKFTVETIKKILSLYYGERHFARFAALETIARVPYFSYTSVLHLYETLGWFRKKEYIKMHFAESWNELHHLLIMESLGGTEEFGDRFIAQHIAFFYYWIVVSLYIVSPATAYNLNMYVERHAFDTYDKFLKSHGEELKQQPAPQVAIDYYQNGDLSLFDSFQYSQIQSEKNEKKSQNNMAANIDTTFMKGSIFAQVSVDTPLAENNIRRPIINNLYDVFYNICVDEAEHAQTMEALSYDIYDINNSSS